MTAREVADALRRYRFRYVDEDGLQAAVADALEREGLDAQREASLDAKNRVDVLVGRIGVEVKIAGPVADVRRQLARYARSESIDGLVLVTTRARHQFPREVEGKPLEVVSLVLGGL